MDQSGDNNNKTQRVPELLAKSLKQVKAGAIDIEMEGQSALRIEVNKLKETVSIDFIHPKVLRLAEPKNKRRLGLFEKLKTAKEFSQSLADNSLTLVFLRKGKEAITLGREADPKLSKLITGSDDIQIDSVRESIKLGRDLK
ncbi:MAG TPA: hypothetical protein VH796_10505 [Nitrososphaeraceae archaeon]|jgi:hypothetical protein